MILVRRGDYGYDAPYALVIFGLLSVSAGLGAMAFGIYFGIY